MKLQQDVAWCISRPSHCAHSGVVYWSANNQNFYQVYLSLWTDIESTVRSFHVQK